MTLLIKRVGSCLSMLVGSIFLFVLVGLLVGPAAYLELSGSTAPGVVTAKREEIRPNEGFWTRQLWVDVQVQTPADPDTSSTPLAVDPATYDTLVVGRPVAVHYVKNPTMVKLGSFVFARLAAQPPFGSFVAVMGNRLPAIGLGVGFWLLLLWAWTRWRTAWLAAGVFAVMAGGALLAGSSWQAAPRAPLAPASATVRQTTFVDKVWGGYDTPAEDAVQSFQVVQLQFVPAGQAEPVVAVDIVDDGSVAALRENAQLAIHYSVGNPRAARIDGAARTYWWKNMRSFVIIGVGLAVLIGGGWFFRSWSSARRRERPSRVP